MDTVNRADRAGGALRVLLLLAALVAGALAGAQSPVPPQASGPPAIAGDQLSTASTVVPFRREEVRRGDQDASPWDIEHVYEVQHRLARLGLFDAGPTGYFGARTEAGVRAFQRRVGLPVTGVVDAATWRPLIQQSLRGRPGIPESCRAAGWHACYDRWWHQVTLFHDGRILDSWLVRGGSSSTPTRTGTFRVYYRDIDHVSSLFDAPMPYSQFFSGGQALHGSRLMMDPYVGHSHGCVNFWVEDARRLWNLTADRNLWVHVHGRWS